MTPQFEKTQGDALSFTGHDRINQSTPKPNQTETILQPIYLRIALRCLRRHSLDEV